MEKKFNLTNNTDCGTCSHKIVCCRDVKKSCGNYELGTTSGTGCLQCLHRANIGKEPCFYCKHHSE